MGDFGIAKVLECTIAVARTQIGTPYYLSPELCQEKPYTTPSDIWAMGCILYEMCARKVPFDAASIPKLVQEIVKGRIPSVPNDYSGFVKGLVAEMLNRDPNKRPGCDEILQKPEIQAVVRGMVAEAQEKEGNPEAKAAPAPKEAPAAAGGKHAASAGNYKKDDLVEYLSTAHQAWLPAVVISVDADGRILLDLKPNTWISTEQQASVVRPRIGGAVGSVPPRACASPLRGRSPSVGTPRCGPSAGCDRPGAPNARPGSRDGRPASGRPGSRGASPMHRSPSGNMLSARGAAGSYRVGDLCEFWSNSHGDWLPAQVINTDPSGRITIDLKPNTWISKEEQTIKIRPRKVGAAPRPSSRPSSANRTPGLPQIGGSPQLPRPPLHRSPSWGSNDNRAPSPAGRAGTPQRWENGLRAASPSGRPMTPSRAFSPGGSRVRTPTPRGYAGQGPARPPRVSQSPLRAGGAAIAGF